VTTGKFAVHGRSGGSFRSLDFSNAIKSARARICNRILISFDGEDPGEGRPASRVKYSSGKDHNFSISAHDLTVPKNLTAT